ncbi:BsuPI-related putative proteinase inhibitor [Alkalihalobacillus sp. MEB130]|uniref:BsuPI-related putative proteinase inhibitor n=1 Tax=Alkalihalobacillus sp. MEB130 TaxID=2976704 RepID=UPI0028DE0282|nr:BsuPI-related putative proteinase inhibitor [Alkalihalobacillus sp. MEB130]MDT8859596.1 BsuPI-related putative proteinase inhibitor [Alkalihalobacillus sp. MEB130]
MRRLSWLLSIVLLLSACGQGATAPLSNGEGDEGVTDSNWIFTVEAEQIDKELVVTLLIKNNQEQAATIDFSSGQKYELVLVAEDGTEVYRYSDGRMFTMALVHETFEPGESMEFQERINVEDIPKGAYTLEAQLVLAAIDGETWTEDGTFEKQVNVTIE